jgi:hypothetical protein
MATLLSRVLGIRHIRNFLYHLIFTFSSHWDWDSSEWEVVVKTDEFVLTFCAQRREINIKLKMKNNKIEW